MTIEHFIDVARIAYIMVLEEEYRDILRKLFML